MVLLIYTNLVLRDLKPLRTLFGCSLDQKLGAYLENQYNAEKNSNMYQALSPIYNIPKSSDRVLPPQFFLVGSKDSLTTPASVREYIEKLESFDHKTEYWEYEDRNHAFLDSGSNFFLGSNFEEDAPQAIDMIIDFLDRVFEEN